MAHLSSVVKVYDSSKCVLQFTCCGAILSTIKIMAKFIECYKYDYNSWPFCVRLKS